MRIFSKNYFFVNIHKNFLIYRIKTIYFMFDEMSYLFNVSTITQNVNTDTQSSTNQTLVDSTGSYYDAKYTITKGDVKNFIKSNINSAYDTNGKNPYMKLIEDFNSSKTPKSLHLRHSDFSYLKNLGVYPINRLMILRRYAEGVVVPADLNNLNVEPISTIIGWVKEDQSMINFGVGENWIQQGSDKMLHKLINDIISNEFGLNLTQLVPIPGWGLNFMFTLLQNLGLINPDLKTIPIGNPNLLKESITRDHENFGLKSNFNITFETSYEQKYIGGIDPYVAQNDLIYNIMTMGTSDTVIIGNFSSGELQKLRAANEDSTNATGWSKLISDMVKGFVGALKGDLGKAISAIDQIAKPAPTQPASGGSDKKATNKNNTGGLTQVTSSTAGKFNLLNSMFKNDLVQGILASTVARYTWPLRGSIAMFTGEASTPWHITIGNPYSPILSMNNVYVSNIDIKGSNELAFNDMLKSLDVKVSLQQGRNLGRKEIKKFFGVEYQRYYRQQQSQASPSPSTTTKK